MRGEWGNHHEKLGLKRISCVIQFTIPDTAGTCSDPACTNTDTRSSQPNQASRTPDFSNPLVSSTSFSSSSPFCVFPIHNSNIIAKLKVKSSLSLSPCHGHQLTPSTAYTEYTHTPSTAYTKIQHIPKYSIHQSTAYTKVQHPPKIVCLSFILMITS